MTAGDCGRTFDYIFEGRGFDAYSDRALETLARLMTALPSESPEGASDPEEGGIPAGYTYLGQFIDHDLVFDETSRLDRLNDIGALENSAAPRFDLDSLYGRKSAPEDPTFEPPPSVAFRLGDRLSTDPRLEGPDLPRVGRRAQIGDRRNDENLMISQLHGLLLRFHNRMAGHVKAAQPPLAGDALFEEVRRQVCWHYQWVVVHDFLPRIVGPAMVDHVLRIHTARPGEPAAGRRFFDPYRRLFMPLEFSGAAYRFGHSMVRPVYRINAAIRRPLLTRSIAPNNLENLLGFRPLPQGWGVQWKYFFELGGNPPQRARRIDPHLVDPLRLLSGIVPEGPLSLAERNLRRGRALGLPSGQQVADAMNVPRIPDKDLLVGPLTARIPIHQLNAQFTGNAPLWYYILREAELEHAGNRLGLVGGRLVAETLIGLLAADASSYLNARPAWTPSPPFAPRGSFGMPELIRATVAYL